MIKFVIPIVIVFAIIGVFTSITVPDHQRNYLYRLQPCRLTEPENDGTKSHYWEQSWYDKSIFDNKDTCLDIGICKAGLTLKIDGQNITVNKDTCSQLKGVWQDKTNACWFKN